jgi:hypothetical protein
MRRWLLVLALAAGAVLLLDTLAWAPPLYGLKLEGSGGGRAVVRSLAESSALADPTARQRQFADAVAGETLDAPNSSYDFDATPIDGARNPTRTAVEKRCSPGNRIVLTSERVSQPPPDGVANDALTAPVIADIEEPAAGESSPRFKLSLPIAANADGEYYLLVRCVEIQDLRDEGIGRTPDQEALQKFGKELDSPAAQTSGPFEPFRNFGTNLYVYQPEEAPPGAGILPTTGGPLAGELVVAAGLLATGVGLLALGRRLRRSGVPDGTRRRWRAALTIPPGTAMVTGRYHHRTR